MGNHWIQPKIFTIRPQGSGSAVFFLPVAGGYNFRGMANKFPSGNSLFPDVETDGFLYGNKEFFLLARKSSNYKEAYLNTLTNNCAD